jgi:hypothetical protein
VVEPRSRADKEPGLVKRIICIEIRYDDDREQRRRASPDAKQAEVAAKAAAKAAAEAVIRSAGMKVTETSSSSTFDDRRLEES